MDEKGVHFPLNAQKSTVPDVGTASSVQTVIGKDKSNPLMAVTLPKSEKDEGSSSRRRLPLSFNQTSDKKLKNPKKLKCDISIKIRNILIRIRFNNFVKLLML